MKAKDFNNFKDTGLSRSLKRDDVVRYRLCDIKKDPLLENKNREIIPFNINLPVVDQIVDKEGKTHNIAYIRRVAADGSVELGSIDFVIDNAGYVILRGTNPEDHKRFQYMELTNYNKSNTLRNPTVRPIFYRVDSQTEAKEARDKRKLILVALNKAQSLTDAEIENIHKLVGGKQTYSVEETRDAVEKYAEKNPDKFIEIATSESIDLESTLKEAVKQQILHLDHNDGIFTYKEKTLFKYKKVVGAKPYKLLADELTKNNPDFINEISKRVKHKT